MMHTCGVSDFTDISQKMSGDRWSGHLTDELTQPFLCCMNAASPLRPLSRGTSSWVTTDRCNGSAQWVVNRHRRAGTRMYFNPPSRLCSSGHRPSGIVSELAHLPPDSTLNHNRELSLTLKKRHVWSKDWVWYMWLLVYAFGSLTLIMKV